jgi:antitoxin (DNA-binding transcriptional repressor) of toxin-antitoxin stability system
VKQIDLDDLPPKVAQTLSALQDGEELVLVRHGAVVGRLAVQAAASPPAGESLSDLPAEERMKEVLDQFNAMIHDEF